MSEPTERWGSCLCGQISVIATPTAQSVGACHCSMCRKWGGGPFMTVDCGTEVTFRGEEHVSVFDSSEWAERGFCSKCGGHLFYRIKGTGRYIMAAGIFEGDETWVFDHQVFIDEKPGYYDFKNETQDLTGAQVFAMFAEPG